MKKYELKKVYENLQITLISCVAGIQRRAVTKN